MIVCFVTHHLAYFARIQRTGTTTDIPVSPSHSPARSVAHSIKPQSPVPTDEAAGDEVGVDFRDGERNISRTVPKPPRDFGKYVHVGPSALC